MNEVVVPPVKEEVEGAFFHAIADYTYGVEAWFDPAGRLVWINRSIERVSGYTPAECQAAESLVQLLVFDKDRSFVATELERALAEERAVAHLEVRLRRKDGSVGWVEINWQPIYGGGRYLGLRVSMDDIQARKEVERKLLETVSELRRAQGLKEHYLNRANEERARLDALLNVLDIGVLFVDNDRRVTYTNRAVRLAWGFDADENLTGLRDVVLTERTAALRADDAAYRRQLESHVGTRTPIPPFDIPLVDGRILLAASNLVPAAEPDCYNGRVWTYEDVTERRRIAEQLLQMATHDALTNLFNRRRFQEELERILADADRRRSAAGLLMFDLDGFKPINDTFGHQAGDEVLVHLTREVASSIRRNEMFFRLGGDEFALLVSDTDEAAMVALAERIGEQISAMRFTPAGCERRLTVSMGIALYPGPATDPDSLVVCADKAMYEAKTAGKNTARVFR
jgi:diguanylate cyclase (GGDEF)-like protein/PAS domain S-box-containing protein